MPNPDIAIERQIRWLVSRLGLSAERARLVAGLAFQDGGHA